MSKDVTTSEEKPTHDFTQEDLRRIAVFKEKGMLGLAEITDVDITRMMDHYLSGKPYREIAQILRKDKTLIMFLSQKLDWYEMRRTYIEELQLTIRDRVMEAKLQSQEFLLKLGDAFQRKIGRAVDQFLRTDNFGDALGIDLKEIDKYLKIVESLHRLNGEMKPGGDFGNRPLVGVNAGEGMTIKKIGENQIEITPGSSQSKASRLKQFADMKRNLEKEQFAHDIEDGQNVEGDNDETDE